LPGPEPAAPPKTTKRRAKAPSAGTFDSGVAVRPVRIDAGNLGRVVKTLTKSVPSGRQIKNLWFFKILHERHLRLAGIGARWCVAQFSCD
jgi:hypothetical protein